VPAPALLTLTSPSGDVLAGLRLTGAAALLQTPRWSALQGRFGRGDPLPGDA